MSTTTPTTANQAGEIWSERYRQFVPSEWADKDLTWDGQRWFLFDDQSGSEPAAEKTERYNPDDHNVAEVKAYLEEHPEDRARILKAERRGQGRKGILGE